MTYLVYIVLCKDETLYTGITTDIKRRLAEHKSGTASRYTRSRGVKKLLYSEKCTNRSRASKREAEIKKWPRKKKLELAQTPHIPVCEAFGA